MVPALAFFVAAIAAPPAASDSAAQLLRQACIDTDMQRAAFEQVGQDQHWRRAQRTTSSPPSPGDWNVSFRVGQNLAMMSNIPTAPGQAPAAGVACTVIVQRPASNWGPELDEIAANLGMTSGTSSSLAGVDEMRIWASGSSNTMTATFVQTGGQTLSITYVRRIEP